VVEDSKRAKKALDEAKLSYTETRAEEVELPNKPGALAQTLDKLAAKGVNLNSICAIEVDRPACTLCRSQESKNIDLGVAECPCDFRYRSRPIFNCDCELLSFL
jgi:hypothetical protein